MLPDGMNMREIHFKLATNLVHDKKMSLTFRISRRVLLGYFRNDNFHRNNVYCQRSTPSALILCYHPVCLENCSNVLPL